MYEGNNIKFLKQIITVPNDHGEMLKRSRLEDYKEIPYGLQEKIKETPKKVIRKNKMQTMNGVAKTGVLTSGTAVIVPMLNVVVPATVWVVPVAGDTVAVSYSVDNGVTYSAWPKQCCYHI